METKTSAPKVASAPGAAATSIAGDDAGTGNIDKVRDILFGGQMRDYERRFARLEERLVKETAELKDDIRQRLAALESFVRQEGESLAGRLTSEQEERTDATKRLEHDASETAKTFEKKTAQLGDQIGRVQRELRQQVLELQQTMSDDLRRKIDEVMAQLTRESSELRHDKTDRATLASLLTEMAMRLNNELAIPNLDDDRNG